MPNEIKYIEIGSGEVILFLHGWGQNKEMMLPLIEDLKDKYKCVILDLPGFGESKFNNAKNIEDYVDNIRLFLEQKNMLPKYIVGHSFGGKLAVHYFLKYKDINRIAIIASPILKPKRGIKYYYKVYKYKLTKRFLKKGNAGSEDYKNCSLDMRRFFVNVVNTHYDNKIKEINIPILLLWGDKDNKVPLSKAKILNRLMPNSDLHIVKGSHFAYLENIAFSRLLLNKFFRR